MAQCEYCDKKSAMGNQIETRGKAKYLGGVGTKVTGISRREFKPNLQRVKITTPGGTNRYARVCTRCLKKGVVRKAIQQAPFKLPVSAQKALQQKSAPTAKGAPAAKVPAAAKPAPAKSAPAKTPPKSGK
jgi:large subunit ribosomal protein L28